PCDQAAKRHHRHTAGFHRGVEPACNRLLYEKGFWPRACRYSRSAGARAAPFRGTFGPRHHPAGAWRRQRALDAFRRALAIHPHLERIPELVQKLSEKIEGREI